MLADAFTKTMPPDLLMRYLQTGIYSFKYDEQIKETKREQAKERSRVRQEKLGKTKSLTGSSGKDNNASDKRTPIAVKDNNARAHSVNLAVHPAYWSLAIRELFC